MVDARSLDGRTVELPTRPSGWRFLLPVVWAGLAVRIVLAFVRHESLREDYLSLALVAFFMTTAVLGSRIWLWVHLRLEQSADRRGHGPPAHA